MRLAGAVTPAIPPTCVNVIPLLSLLLVPRLKGVMGIGLDTTSRIGLAEYVHPESQYPKGLALTISSGGEDVWKEWK